MAQQCADNDLSSGKKLTPNNSSFMRLSTHLAVLQNREQFVNVKHESCKKKKKSIKLNK